MTGMMSLLTCNSNKNNSICSNMINVYALHNTSQKSLQFWESKDYNTFIFQTQCDKHVEAPKCTTNHESKQYNNWFDKLATGAWMFTWSIDSCMRHKNIQTLLLLRSHTFTVVQVVVLVITWHLVLSLIYLHSTVMHTQKGISASHAIQVPKCA